MRRLVSILIIFLQLHISVLYAFNPYSNDALDELEKEFVHEINQSGQVLRDPLLNQYINQIGSRLSRVANMPEPHFFIVNSPEINAFAGPGGHIGVNTGLILTSSSESELAAVMAHELAHVRLHHLYRMMQHQSQMRIPMLASMLASIALGLINPTLGSGAMMASVGGLAQDSINFTRAKEKEADRIGIDMLIRAGFDPRAMAGFFKKMQQTTRLYYSANVPAILRTHPLDDERIAEAENRSLHLLNKSVVSPLEYHLFKEAVRVSISTGSTEQSLLYYYQHGCTQGIACQYGDALRHLNLNHFSQAETALKNLEQTDKTNLFFQIALAEAEAESKQVDKALNRLKELQNNFPENYAILRAYAHILMTTGQPEKASMVLLKGQRRYKKDLAICEELAKAYSAAHRKSYAYFTQSQCQLLQGRPREAMRELKLVTKLAEKDPYLLARANAMIDEIKYLQGK